MTGNMMILAAVFLVAQCVLLVLFFRFIVKSSEHRRLCEENEQLKQQVKELREQLRLPERRRADIGDLL